MITIQQAIYGEIPGKTKGHDLLAATDKQREFFRHVSGKTDLADRPQGGILNKPIVRGFFTDDHFLLVKNFPDRSQEVRSARVFAHVLFIRKADLHKVTHISQLFRSHMSDIHKEAEMPLLEYNPLDLNNLSGAVRGREEAATNALLQQKNFVWLGERGYWDFIDRIWPQLPLEAKYKMRIGAAFSPAYLKDENLNIVYIPAEAKQLWERHHFSVLDTHKSELLQSGAAHWLLGNSQEASDFQALIDDFEPKISSIDLLSRLQNHGKVYHRLDQKPQLNRMLVLSDFISRVNPNEKSGSKGKSRLIAAILQAIPVAKIDHIKALNYQSWKGFNNAKEIASTALHKWLSKNLLAEKNAKYGGSILIQALENGTSNWWSETVLDYINGRLKNRQDSDAKILWEWMIEEPVLISKHAIWLPDDAENELSQKLPKLDATTAESVVKMTTEKGWFLLHAKVAAQHYSPSEAIEAQLRIDTDDKHTEAIEALSKCINDSSFVTVAATHTDVRLHRIAGKLIAGNGKLLKGMKIDSEGWQDCWEAAIEEGGQVWSGIRNPQQTLFEILDHMLGGNSFSEILIKAMSTSNFSSLKDYPCRSSIWPYIPVNARQGFIKATIIDMIDELISGQMKNTDLEPELQKGIRSVENQQQIIGSQSISLSNKIQLLKILPGLSEQQALKLILENHFTQAEAEILGGLVSQKRWMLLANNLYDLRIQRRDLVPALLKCTSLLNFFQRLYLSATGLKTDGISKEEWWNEFLTISMQLYPFGPEQDGLWLSAGGDLSEINATGSGRHKWSHAIQIIRNNGKPNIKKLLKKMLETYSNNETLKNLDRTYE